MGRRAEKKTEIITYQVITGNYSIMEKYNIPEDEAKKYMQYTNEPIDDVDD